MLRQRSLGPTDSSGSPQKKRPRLSAEGDSTFSRASSVHPSTAGASSSQTSSEAKQRRRLAIEAALMNDKQPDAVVITVPVVTEDEDDEIVPSSQDDERSEIDDAPVVEASPSPPRRNTPWPISKTRVELDDDSEVPKSDYDDFFKPVDIHAAFVPASQLPSIAGQIQSQRPVDWAMPSQAALERASRVVEAWQRDPEESTLDDPPALLPSSNGRLVLGALENIPKSGNSSGLATKKMGSPAPFRPPLHTPLRLAQNSPSPAMRGSQPLPGLRLSSFSRPNFGLVHQNSPLNPASTPLPSQSRQPSTPARSGLGMTPRSRPVFSTSRPRPSFSTPFKVGMKPGEPGALQKQKAKAEAEALAAEQERRIAELRERERKFAVFDLTPPPLRNSLEMSGVCPGSSSIDDLIENGVAPELQHINIFTAPYYRFNSATASGSFQQQGISEAIQTLKENGCKLLTTEWATNHWSMVLWKLAGLIFACPALFEEKWTYKEVIKQLLYRYERELNRAQRPPIRLITEGDTSSARPMVLCIVAITPGEDTVAETGEVVEGLPSLEVSDGWYKIRATADAPMGRAVKKGHLRVGSKIAVSGARLQGSKEGMEPLAAFEKVHLELHGNSTTLARWDTKLGFQPTPFIATLRSLTADGGPAMLLDLKVLKLFPMGYVEMRDDGERPTPKCAAEEREAEEAWKARRSNEESKLQTEHSRKLDRLEGVADILERNSGGFRPSTEDDSPSYQVEDIYEEMEDSTDPLPLAKGLSPKDSGWLALLIRRKCAASRETNQEVIARELDQICPPRNVRNFRVIRFRDYRTPSSSRRHHVRTGQMTVWDVLALGDGLQEGKRFLVTNIVPCQPSAWSHQDAEAEAYFNSRRDTRWTSLPLDRSE